MGRYVALLLVITTGVCAGNLLSNFISAQWLAYQAQQVAVSVERETQKFVAEQSRERSEQQQKLQQQRMTSRRAKQLRASCDDWKRAHQQFANNTSNREMTKACTAYQRYIREGR